MFKPEIGIDDQTARLNSRPLQGDEIEDTRDALTKYKEMQARHMAALGVSEWTHDIKPDNATLKAALAKIAASGAPTPVIDRVVSWSPLGIVEQDVYIYSHFNNPRLQLRAGETLLASSPDTVIAELTTYGIKAK
jgi:hypothetical protein